MKLARVEFDRVKIMRYVAKLAIHPFLFFVRFLSYLAPRSNTIWVLGALQKFEGNTKYLFLYIHNTRQKGIQAVWISHNKKLVQELRQHGYPAHYHLSLQGIFYCLRAKVFIVDTSIEVISYWLSGGATLINLFHALPIKKMEWDVKKGDSPDVVLIRSKGFMRLLMRFLFPWRFLQPEYVASTSPLYTTIFMSMFRLGTEHIMETGYPRNDVLLEDIAGSDIGADTQLLSEMVQMKQENPQTKFCLYAPTFRDTGGHSFLEEGALLKTLDELLRKYHAVFWVKIHPFTKLKTPEVALENIRFISPALDSYPFLKLADILITDYSSIFVDFLLIDRTEIFFPYDYEKYITKDRELYFDYNDFTPGPKAHRFEEFLLVLERTLQGKDDYATKRIAQQQRCFANTQGNASARTFDFLKNL